LEEVQIQTGYELAGRSTSGRRRAKASATCLRRRSRRLPTTPAWSEHGWSSWARCPIRPSTAST